MICWFVGGGWAQHETKHVSNKMAFQPHDLPNQSSIINHPSFKCLNWPVSKRFLPHSSKVHLSKQSQTQKSTQMSKLQTTIVWWAIFPQTLIASISWSNVFRPFFILFAIRASTVPNLLSFLKSQDRGIFLVSSRSTEERTVSWSLQHVTIRYCIIDPGAYSTLSTEFSVHHTPGTCQAGFRISLSIQGKRDRGNLGKGKWA